MSESYVERISSTMHRLLYINIIEPQLKLFLVGVPILGWPVIRDIILYAINTYLIEELFLSLTRFGVFTSIDWENDKQYEAYKSQAIRIIGMQDRMEWPKNDREEFKKSARALINFHVK